MAGHALTSCRKAARFAGLACALAAPAAAQLSDIYPVPAVPVQGSGDFLAADLDLDGRLDGLLLDQPVAIALALPAGGYAAATYVNLGFSPRELNAADMDGDGWPDLIGCGYFEGSFAIAPGTGVGHFAPPDSWFVDDHLRGVGVGDLNGDGFMDVATAGEASPFALHASLADGAGDFLAPASFTQTLEPTDLELADINQDGDLDAVYLFDGSVSAKGRVVVCTGDGAGGFAAAISHQLPGLAAYSIVRDLDVDGDLDIAVTCRLPDVVAVVRDIGAGLGSVESWPVGPSPTRIDAGDLDGTGVPDLVTSHGNWSVVSVLRANGAGGYLAAEVLAGHGQVGGIMVTDATADGLLDVVTHNWSPGSWGVMAGHGTGELTACERYKVDIPLALTVADVDDDGHPDLIAATAGKTVGTLLADGEGGFLPVQVSTFPASSFGDPADVAAGDVTGDGLPDVLVPTDSVLVLVPNEGAGLAPVGTVVTGSLKGTAVELADLDEDGRLDALETHYKSQGSVISEESILRFLNSPSGLQAPVMIPGVETPEDLAVGDLDGDGHADAAVVGAHPGLFVLLGDGGGDLAALSPTLIGGYQVEVELGDFDLDGHLDALVLKDQEGLEPKVSLLHGNGAGGLTLASELFGQPLDGDLQIAAADVDGDGWLDLVQTGTNLQALRVRLNDTAGGWLPELWFAGGIDAYALALADLDGDHRPDALSGGDSLIFVNPQGSVTVLRNAADFRWTDLGFALPGTLGAPQLAGTGALTPGSPGDLRLFHAQPLSPALLFVSWTSAPASFKGGTLVPLPPLAQLVVVTDAAGSLVASWPAWPFASSEQEWYFQYAILDAAAVHGVALSNALKAVEP